MAGKTEYDIYGYSSKEYERRKGTEEHRYSSYIEFGAQKALEVIRTQTEGNDKWIKILPADYLGLESDGGKNPQVAPLDRPIFVYAIKNHPNIISRLTNEGNHGRILRDGQRASLYTWVTEEEKASMKFSALEYDGIDNAIVAYLNSKLSIATPEGSINDILAVLQKIKKYLDTSNGIWYNIKPILLSLSSGVPVANVFLALKWLKNTGVLVQHTFSDETRRTRREITLCNLVLSDSEAERSAIMSCMKNAPAEYLEWYHAKEKQSEGAKLVQKVKEIEQKEAPEPVIEKTSEHSFLNVDFSGTDDIIKTSAEKVGASISELLKIVSDVKKANDKKFEEDSLQLKKSENIYRLGIDEQVTTKEENKRLTEELARKDKQIKLLNGVSDEIKQNVAEKLDILSGRIISAIEDYAQKRNRTELETARFKSRIINLVGETVNGIVKRE